MAKQALILANNADVGLLISEHVRGAGYDCQTITRVSEAIPKIGDERFQVLICDFNFSDGSSTRVLKAAQARGDDMPVLLFVDDAHRPVPPLLRSDSCLLIERFDFQRMREVLTLISEDSVGEIG